MFHAVIFNLYTKIAADGARASAATATAALSLVSVSRRLPHMPSSTWPVTSPSREGGSVSARVWSRLIPV